MWCLFTATQKYSCSHCLPLITVYQWLDFLQLILGSFNHWHLQKGTFSFTVVDGAYQIYYYCTDHILLNNLEFYLITTQQTWGQVIWVTEKTRSTGNSEPISVQRYMYILRVNKLAWEVGAGRQISNLWTEPE